MKIDVTLPELGENIEKGEIVKWLVNEGDVIAAEQAIMELETGKAVVEVPSTAAGRITKLHLAEGDSADVGAVVLTLEGGVETPLKSEPKSKAKESKSQPQAEPAVQQSAQAVPAKETRPAPSANGGKALPAAPGVKRVAREAGVNLQNVPGTGAGGRITVEDLAARVHGEVPAYAAPQVPLPDFSKWGAVERKPMSNVRKATAEHLSRTWTTTPQVTQFDKADITNLEVLRKKHAAKAEAAGGKLTTTAIALKLCAIAMEKFPQFNASVDMSGGTIIYKKYVNIGVAVDTDRGLLVPVIRDCNKKGIIELSVDLTRTSEKARKAQLSLEELQGGCFSISNLGGIGGVGFSPIVNGPEVAILGISRASMEPVWRVDQFDPRLMLPMSLSYDHRLIDGADAARFLRFICDAMEEPLSVFM